MLDRTWVQEAYKKLNKALAILSKRFERPLTYSEKILLAHLYAQEESASLRRGHDYALFEPDRVALQDATAQMALLQFMSAAQEKTRAPTTVHCDHLIRAEHGAKADLAQANEESKEVFDFLQSVCRRYGIGFWKPGSGIIHQVLLENYACPGLMMIGTDSHTPNAGGLGMIAIGVGGADAVDVMAGLPWELKFPKIIGVHLTGSLQGWASAKDIILEVAGILTVKGGTGAIVEYFGPGAQSLSCTGKATICNMGAEIGATTSVFPYDESMERYLKATGRGEMLPLIKPELLQIDDEVLKDPHSYYDQLIEIDLDQLTPRINGPFTPDLCHPIEEMKDFLAKSDSPKELSVALIGSCTNSSYEDLQRTCSLARQARDQGLSCRVPLTITPGSDLIYEQMQKEGMLELLTSIGGNVLANACGPCIGQWKRHDVAFGETNSIITSFNRNFSGRNDANPATHAFVASPETVLVMALSGQLDFDPQADFLEGKNGPFQLSPPQGKELPPEGFSSDVLSGFIPPSADPSHEVVIDPQSERLELLAPFPAPQRGDYSSLALLLKAEGKCTTDHISPAGKWLRFRGHLDRISDNLFCGIMNSFEDLIGKRSDPATGEVHSYSDAARALQKEGISWIAVGGENYGEGSSREHAAMEPRYLGARVILVQSFARIHETNLKKQGLLPLTFVHAKDYERIEAEDRFALPQVEVWLQDASMRLPSTLELIVTRKQEEFVIEVTHTLNRAQEKWLRAGSALNTMKA